MSTRRSARVRGPPASAPEPQGATRSKRSTTKNRASNDEAQSQSSPAKEPHVYRGTLTKDALSRRHAPVRERGSSVLSIPTNPPRAEDEDSDYESGVGSEASGPIHVFSDSRFEEEAEPSEEAVELDQAGVEDAAQMEYMAASLGELLTLSQDLFGHLVNPNHDNATFGKVWERRLKHFEETRGEFKDSRSISDFINWRDRAADLDKLSEIETPAAVVLSRANLAMALNAIESLRADSPKAEPLLTFTSFADAFPDLFTTGGAQTSDIQLALDVRTQQLIEMIASPKASGLGYGAIAAVFCEIPDKEPSTNAEYRQLFLDGPFKPLVGGDPDTEEQMCIERLHELVAIVSKGRKDIKAKVRPLRDAFPRDKTLDDLRAWILEAYKSIGKRRLEEPTARRTRLPEADVFHDAEEQQSEEKKGEEDDEDDDDDSDEGSQPIIRRPQNHTSLFRNESSFKVLQKGKHPSAIRPPPSNQQQNGDPPQGTAEDYHHETNSELLHSPSRSLAVRPAQKRVHAQVIEDDEEEEDDDDPFQTDDRPRHRTLAKSAVSESSARKSKRPRSAYAGSASGESPSSSQQRHELVSSRPSADLPAAEGSVLSTDNTSRPRQSTQPAPRESSNAAPSMSVGNSRSRELLSSSAPARARTPATPPKRQRRSRWTDEDCKALLFCIEARGCKWSEMQKDDGDLFEHPRDQQGYRDKARNMKVEYLLSDQLLPVNFDGVALGVKEISLLKSKGKNPDRMEADHDGQRPTNTEY